MNSQKDILKRVIPVILLITISVTIISCSKKIDKLKVKSSEILSLPTTTVRDNRTVYDDSGKVQLILTFPLLESYENKDDPYSEFRSGITVDFYDGHKNPVGKVTAKYAKFMNKKKLWELKDSVVVINESNDKLETEQLF